jgi:hypothetical protein
VTHPRRPGDPRADRLRARHEQVFGDRRGPPVPVEAIAEDLLGLMIGEADLDVSGLLIPAERRIWVDAGEARDSPARRRFTIAHEIGHWVCQVRAGRGEPIHCRIAPSAATAPAGPEPPPTDPREREANVFAAELLMPEDLLHRALDRGVPLDDLPRRFAVSPPAMAWRLYNLGIADDPPGAVP